MTPVTTVSRRRFGDVEAATIHTGYVVHTDEFEPWRLPDGWVAKHADRNEQGTAQMGINSLYVRTPHATLVLDPSSFTDEDSLAPYAELERGPILQESLSALGVDPADVTHVVISHGHHDHYSGVLADPRSERRLLFPNATHHFPSADWSYFVDAPPPHLVGPAEHAATLMRPVEQAGRLQLVDGDTVIAPGVALLHTGGETEGHQIIRIETGDGVLFYLGDLFHLPAEYEQLDTGPGHRDYEALAAVRRRVLTVDGLADERSVAVATHGRFPAWGTVRPHGDSWQWTYLER